MDQEPTDNVTALAGILALAITAPDDERAARALELAERLSGAMSAIEVARAKEMALEFTGEA